MRKIILGIDPGKSGAIVAIHKDSGEIILTQTFPLIGKEVNIVALGEIVSNFGESTIHAYLEQVHAIFGSSAGSTFSFGRVYGMLEALLAANKIPYTLVQPKIWQKVIFNGVPEIRKPRTKNLLSGKTTKGRVDNKKMALLASTRLFPNEDLRATERSKKPHDGIVDALLIAEYGRRNHDF